MCPRSEEDKNDDFVPEPQVGDNKMQTMKLVVAGLAVTSIGLLASTIVLAVKDSDNTSTSEEMLGSPESVSFVPNNKLPDIETVFSQGTNICENKDPKYRSKEWDNVDCVHLPGPQAGANVTKGYKGGMEVDYVPQTKTYWQSSMCPVNVHWHLGTEHYSVGEYDENGDGPNGNIPAPERRLGSDEEVRAGFRCHHYDASDPKFTTKYDWKHCIGMQVGETYEVHWPHSAAGACGSVNQYQTPFYDGVFCNLDDETISGLGPQDVAHAVGVQAQIFTIVNDESYFYPDMIRGWIVDGDFGKDIHYYTGSTTGTSRSNEICSKYTPITWQVDRKCHMISASAFDKLCYDMKNQRDNMADDLYAHGSRELVKDALVANNQQRKLQMKKEHDHHHDHHHLRTHDTDGHHHHHHEWY